MLQLQHIVALLKGVERRAGNSEERRIVESIEHRMEMRENFNY